jgi:hypothetical protein
MSRVALSAGLWFATTYALSFAAGTQPAVMDVAVDAAILSGCALASDAVHSATGMAPSPATSAAVTAALYAAAEKAYRNDDNYLMNAALAAGNDFAVENYQKMQRIAAWKEAMEQQNNE